MQEAVFLLAANPRYDDFMRTISQSLRHFKKAGFSDSVIEHKLKGLIEANSKMLRSDWASSQNRKKMLDEIVNLRQAIRKLIDQQAGPDFKAWED